MNKKKCFLEPFHFWTYEKNQRKITINGHMDIKDGVFIGSDNWNHPVFSSQVMLSPDYQERNLLFTGNAGDVEILVNLNLFWNSDNSITISWNVKMLNNGESVTDVENNSMYSLPADMVGNYHINQDSYFLADDSSHIEFNILNEGYFDPYA